MSHPLLWVHPLLSRINSPIKLWHLKGVAGLGRYPVEGGESSFALDRRVWLHDVHLDKLVEVGEVTPTARMLNLASKFRKQRNTQNLP